LQPSILPDYLDRSKKSKNDYLNIISINSQLVKYATVVDRVSMDINLGPENPVFDGVSLRQVLPLLSGDESFKIYMKAYKGYLDNKGNNYIVSNSLREALLNTKLDIKCSFLPKNFSAYIQTNNLFDQEGEEIKGVFVDITDKYGPSFYMGFITFNREMKTYSVGHLNIPLEDKDKSIKEIVETYKTVYRGLTPEVYEKLYGNIKGFQKQEDGLAFSTKTKYHDYLHIIFNVILYIHYHNEPFEIKTNNFSSKTSKYVAQTKIYTTKPYILLGENFRKPKEYTCGEVGVSGHFRWQPYGPSKSLLKHIYIKPHTRNYNKS
jgi:hypothetical protein